PRCCRAIGSTRSCSSSSERPVAEALAPEAIAAIVAHMNGDHADDNVVICWGAGGRADVERAELVDLDERSLTFEIETTAGATEALTVPFRSPVTERAQVRIAVVELFDESAAQLGLPARRPR